MNGQAGNTVTRNISLVTRFLVVSRIQRETSLTPLNDPTQLFIIK